MDEVTITGITISVSMEVLNTKGLRRRAGLEMEITMDLYEEMSSNKAKWNKYVGDMTKQAVDACTARVREEYQGLARSEGVPHVVPHVVPDKPTTLLSEEEAMEMLAEEETRAGASPPASAERD